MEMSIKRHPKLCNNSDFILAAVLNLCYFQWLKTCRGCQLWNAITQNSLFLLCCVGRLAAAAAVCVLQRNPTCDPLIFPSESVKEQKISFYIRCYADVAVTDVPNTDLHAHSHDAYIYFLNNKYFLLCRCKLAPRYYLWPTLGSDLVSNSLHVSQLMDVLTHHCGHLQCKQQLAASTTRGLLI